MKLDALKKAWQQDSSRHQHKKLSKEQIRAALNNKTLTITEKIERNIKVALIIVIAYIIFNLILNLLFGSKLTDVPEWIKISGAVVEILIFLSFSFFVFQYYKVKKNCGILCNLRETLERTIDILKLSEKLYFFVFSIYIASAYVSFLSGVYKGIVESIKSNGMTTQNIDNKEIALMMGIVIIIGLILFFLVFLLIRWIFRRLFGQYLKQLQDTLKELNEIE